MSLAEKEAAQGTKCQDMVTQMVLAHTLLERGWEDGGSFRDPSVGGTCIPGEERNFRTFSTCSCAPPGRGLFHKERAIRQVFGDARGIHRTLALSV